MRLPSDSQRRTSGPERLATRQRDHEWLECSHSINGLHIRLHVAGQRLTSLCCNYLRICGGNLFRISGIEVPRLGQEVPTAWNKVLLFVVSEAAKAELSRFLFVNI